VPHPRAFDRGPRGGDPVLVGVLVRTSADHEVAVIVPCLQRVKQIICEQTSAHETGVARNSGCSRLGRLRRTDRPSAVSTIQMPLAPQPQSIRFCRRGGDTI
jgi:hypothetical protein